MITRRKEPFRYSMQEPVECQLELTTVNRMSLSGKLIPAQVIDISKNGCKIRSALDLKASEHFIECRIHLRLNEQQFIFPGQIRWQRNLDGFSHDYGIHLLLTEDEKEQINVQLRGLAAERKIIVM
ncbi:hypothetical protein AWM70_13785 [Paenibacillus yonginensis]|uniref:PilZ domain-containing protein n=1 Tax=Paenibacillus yonginensis TaxID=1462996 RepID=A0A1B1N299_9BACL|nr:PilZ domain-containing protein [Paenibacillus yonginensis]ANS75538.1 hypothetical protein AWM70_13785 [Paenibacillus yonginensis]